MEEGEGLGWMKGTHTLRPEPHPRNCRSRHRNLHSRSQPQIHRRKPEGRKLKTHRPAVLLRWSRGRTGACKRVRHRMGVGQVWWGGR